MKKIVNILFATAVAALAMVSCQKKELAVNVNENETVESPIHFYATEIATKTVFGGFATDQYPTLWTNSKSIKISYNKKSSVEATVTPQSGGTKAVFTPASSFSADGSSHIFYAMSPATAQGANISSSYCSWRFIIPASQTPLTNSVDEDAQIIYAKYDAGDTFPTSVPFAFSHVTAYGKLSFSNLALDVDEDITSITLTASKDWVGHYFYYVATKDPNTEGDFTARDGYVSKKITLTTDKSSDIWFACAPVDLSGGGTIDINIFTNKGVFVKKVTFPAAKGNFQAGHVASFTVNMSGIARTAMVNNIAAIKTLYSSADVPFVANLTNALVTIVSDDNFYMEDATGGVLVYTSGHGMAKGDKLNGVISGTITDFNKTKEITGFDCSATKTPGNVVTPTTIAHGDLVDAFASYESKFVRVEGLTVAAVSGKDITISENANLKIRNESGVTITEGTQLNVEGAAVYYNSNKQVKIYSQADADLLAIGSVITASDKGVVVGGTVPIGATTNSPATITYESDDETVATVNASGVVTGVKAGSATITCSVAASGKYLAASKDITITVVAGGAGKYTVISNLSQLAAGNYLLGGNNEATFSASTDIYLWKGTVNGTASRLNTTSAKTWDNTLKDFNNITDAAVVTLEAGTGTNVWRIKVGSKYLAQSSGTSMTMQDDPFDWTFTELSGTKDGLWFSVGGCKVFVNSSSTTAIRAYNNDNTYNGIHLFKEN